MNKKYLFIIFILVLLLSAFTFSNFKFTKSVVIYVDPDTGVNYICYAAGYKGGICPRYNSDGSLFITEFY